MAGLSALGLQTITAWNAAWHCRRGGFAVVAPVSGSSVVAAVGTLTPAAMGDPDEARRAMRGVLEDRALLEGYDPAALLERANAALSAAGLGHLDAVALLSRPDDRMPASVAGRGNPAPLLVAPDRLTAPVRGNVGLDRGWAVVLGAADADGVPSTLMSPAEVRFALALLEPASPGHRQVDRTVLA